MKAGADTVLMYQTFHQCLGYIVYIITGNHGAFIFILYIIFILFPMLWSQYGH